MIGWIRLWWSRLTGWRENSNRTVDRSQLVGMYLSHANRAPGSQLRSGEDKERRNGKFAQNRRRA